MEINLTIKGTSLNPQLTVTSDPPMPPQEALQVLFTGNAWSSSTSPFNGVTSSQLAENFLNYSLREMNEGQDMGLKTKLTDNLKLGAEMDQMPSAPGETNVYYSRKINGEMDLNDHMSLNVSREFLTQDSYPSEPMKMCRHSRIPRCMCSIKKDFRYKGKNKFAKNKSCARMLVIDK